jgi:hypothetical protein
MESISTSVSGAISYSAPGLDVSAVTVTSPNLFRQDGLMRRALQRRMRKRVAGVGLRGA